jgi:hypothetical protein
MAEFERSVSVATSPGAAFSALSDVRNLPRYVATMVTATRGQGDDLHVAADVQGRHEEGDARFHVDQAGRRLDWGGEGESHYRGWLQVLESAEGSSVTVHIHTVHDQDPTEVDRALDETMLNIERLLGQQA